MASLGVWAERRQNLKLEEGIVTLEAGSEIEFFELSRTDELERPSSRNRHKMGVKKFKPTSPGRRGMSCSDFDSVTTDKPQKRLTKSLSRRLVVTSTVESPFAVVGVVISDVIASLTFVETSTVYPLVSKASSMIQTEALVLHCSAMQTVSDATSWPLRA